MKKILLAATMVMGASAVTLSLPEYQIEAQAKTYKPYISKGYSTTAAGSKGSHFYTKKYKKTLPNGFTISNTKTYNGTYKSPGILVKNKAGKKVYSVDFINLGWHSNFAYAFDKKGYLNITFSTGDRTDTGLTLISISPTGKVIEKGKGYHEYTPNQSVFVTPNKLKIKLASNNSGKNKTSYFHFKNGKISLDL